ncbi:hypothetical protein [Enterobacillus tribolii]|uniref:Uncharacterized protein n=1 Tax=Enterobacillus tribolii TaxID=1487935 RepID=A0A370R1I7_9GAMM|nr:hypothetical protein [Enterobacillus tribolii]MBW7983103.1 hypothetical protein [Enterobacillus tribolii]RDK95793.1 hypothetical protein C8D90_102276 [Enterobacillus tribolii]
MDIYFSKCVAKSYTASEVRMEMELSGCDESGMISSVYIPEIRVQIHGNADDTLLDLFELAQQRTQELFTFKINQS